MKRDVLISVRPQYVNRILCGEKRYEFRTRVPYANRARDVYIYSSAPVQRIVARFPLTKVLEGSPEEIWELCRYSAGIDRDGFFEYFEGGEMAYAIVIDGLQRLDPPVDPFRRFENFRPPQSFYYLKDGVLS